MPPKRKRSAATEQKEVETDQMVGSDEDQINYDIKEKNSKRKKIENGGDGDKKPTRKIKTVKEEKNDSEDLENEEKAVKKGRNTKKSVENKSGKKGNIKKSDSESEKSNESEPEDNPAKTRKSVKSHTKKTKVKEDSGENSEVEYEKPAKKTRTTKKAQSLKEDSYSEEQPAKKSRKKKDSDESEEEKPTKKGRAKKEPKDRKEPNAKASGGKAVKNQTSTNYSNIDFNTCEKNNGKEWNVKISNWNVDGIRAWIKKGGLEYIDYEKPDILCLQETKCSEEKMPDEAANVDGYKIYWHCSKKEGYAGVGLYSKVEPMSVFYGLGIEQHDEDGRMITAEYEKYYVISVYVPNAGRGLVTLPKRLEWNTAFRKYVADLDKKKPVIVCGDMNVAHSEIDLSNPKTNTKNAGFTKEEREGMTEFLSDGYVDTFRNFYPDKSQAYTFWTYMSNCRAKNVGWRLDYFIVSQRFVDCVCDNVIRSQVFGSDHCPITLFLAV